MKFQLAIFKTFFKRRIKNVWCSEPIALKSLNDERQKSICPLCLTLIFFLKKNAEMTKIGISRSILIYETWPYAACAVWTISYSLIGFLLCWYLRLTLIWSSRSNSWRVNFNINGRFWCCGSPRGRKSTKCLSSACDINLENEVKVKRSRNRGVSLSPTIRWISCYSADRSNQSAFEPVVIDNPAISAYQRFRKRKPS